MKCKPGYHYVKSHSRISESGLKHHVEEHCRQNSKNKTSFLYASNLDYIYDIFHIKYSYKKLERIKEFPQDKGQFDKYIQFWLMYWKEQGLINEEIDPLLVKALIAVESSFREDIITKMTGSSATGLMQILKTTMNILSRKLGNEIRKSNIDISQEEALNANINIAAGTRWLIYKITTSPFRKKEKKIDRIFGGIKYYHSWDNEGEDYARKVLSIYEKSKK